MPESKSAMGNPSLLAQDRPPYGGSPAVSEVAEVKYSPDDPVALANFLVSADIALVRAEYIWSLCGMKKLLPRRPEAEHESFESPSGGQTALVHQGLQKWGQAEAEAFCVRFPIAGKRANTQIRVDISWDLLQMPRIGMH